MFTILKQNVLKLKNDKAIFFSWKIYDPRRDFFYVTWADGVSFLSKGKREGSGLTFFFVVKVLYKVLNIFSLG